jgi:hypothetical protein
VDHCRTHERVSEAATSKSRGLPQASWDARGHATPRRRGRATRANRAGRGCAGRRALAEPGRGRGRASHAATADRAGARPRRAAGRRGAARAGRGAVAELRPPRPSWGQASCAATPRCAQGWGRADHGRVSRHGCAQGRAGAVAGTPRRAAPARRARGRRGRGSGRARPTPRPGCRAAMAERQRPGRGSGQASEPRAATPRGVGGRAGAAPRRTRLAGRRARGSGRRTKPGKRAGEPRAATPRHPPRRARRGEERRGKGTGRREQDGLTVGEGACERWRFSCSRAMEEEGASGERFARERKTRVRGREEMNRGDYGDLQAGPTGRAAAAGQLLSAHACDGSGQAVRRLGREPAGLWAARGEKDGGGRRGGGAPDGPQEGNVGPRERGEKRKEKRGLFLILIIFLKA